MNSKPKTKITNEVGDVDLSTPSNLSNNESKQHSGNKSQHLHENTEAESQDNKNISHYASDHPLLNQPPFQPQQISFQPAAVQFHPSFGAPMYPTPGPPPIGFIPAYRSYSMPHIMPSYHVAPQYFVQPQFNSVDQQFNQVDFSRQQQQQENSGNKSEPVSSVFKKTCYKCGNLGHFAEECEFEERLCYNCKQPGHETSECPNPRSTELKQCYICREIGHLQSNCPKRTSSSSSLPSSSSSSSVSPSPSNPTSLETSLSSASSVDSAPKKSSRQAQQPHQIFRRPSQPLSLNTYYYPSHRNSTLTSAPASPLMGSSASMPLHDFRFLLQQQYIDPCMITQRTLYLQNANYAFLQRRSRSGSVPSVLCRHLTKQGNNKSPESKSTKRQSSHQHDQKEKEVEMNLKQNDESKNTSKDIL